MAVKRDMLQVDQGVLLFLASDGLGRPIAALLLSDVSPPFEEEELEKEERDEKEEGSNVENGNEVDINNVLKVEKADIGMKERLELETGLEVDFLGGIFSLITSIFTGVPIYHSTPWSLPLSCWKVVPK